MEFFYINNLSIDLNLCEKIIYLYEKSKSLHYDGITAIGFNKTIKYTTDLILPNNNDWNDINNQLYNILHSELNTYVAQLNSKYSHLNHKFINYSNLYDTGFLMQKYTKGEGMYIYHNDYGLDYKTKSNRVLTYLWYINTVDVGGETEFFGNVKIQPEAGKLIIFPSTWVYPHKACVPLSSDKYIITGWFYANENNYIGI